MLICNIKISGREDVSMPCLWLHLVQHFRCVLRRI